MYVYLYACTHILARTGTNVRATLLFSFLSHLLAADTRADTKWDACGDGVLPTFMRRER